MATSPTSPSLAGKKVTITVTDTKKKELRIIRRVRFESIPIGSKCRTEWDENIMKTKTVRIQTDGNINYRNAVNLDTGSLIPVDSAQWVWIE